MIRLLLFTAFLLLPSCSGAPVVPDDTLDAQETAWNDGDVEAFVEIGYDNSSETTFFSGEDRLDGYKKILSHFKGSYGRGKKEMGELSYRDVDVEFLSDEHALVRGRWRLILSAGKWVDGWFTLIMIDSGDGWQIVHDHTSGGTE
jgi:hypothetical protein